MEKSEIMQSEGIGRVQRLLFDTLQIHEMLGVSVVACAAIKDYKSQF